MIKQYDKKYIPSFWDENLSFGNPYFDFGDCWNILFCARSRSGKGVVLNNLFTQDVIHRTPAKNIFIFSPYIMDDRSLDPLINFLIKSGVDLKSNHRDTVDIELIKSIAEK